MGVIRVQHNATSQAVRYLLNDESDHGIIRGWIGAPPFYDLTEYLEDGVWIIKSPEGAPYKLSDEVFKRDFIVVVTPDGN